MPCLQSASTWSSCEHNSKSQILREHVSELDSSFHSVLSLPSGKPTYKKCLSKFWTFSVVKSNSVDRRNLIKFYQLFCHWILELNSFHRGINPVS